MWAILFEDKIWPDWENEEAIKFFDKGELQWEHEMDQAIQEGLLVRRWRHAVSVDVLDHMLKLSASCLIEAVEVKSVQNLHFFLSQQLHFVLNVLWDRFDVAVVG